MAISFSVTDYIGHLFGPSSLEAEDNILRVDRLLADLLQFVDDQVGLDQTLIIVSADHGMSEAPEYMQSLGFEVGRLTSDTIVKGTSKLLDRLRPTILLQPLRSALKLNRLLAQWVYP